MRVKGFNPRAEKAAHASMRGLLRAHATAPQMANAEFFQHHLMRQIERENEAPVPRERGWWTWPRLVWAGAACLLAATLSFKAFIPTDRGAADRSNYFATVVDSRTFEPDLSVDTVYNPEDNVTVVWIDGLDYMQGDIVAR
jgi:hypothetical protein